MRALTFSALCLALLLNATAAFPVGHIIGNGGYVVHCSWFPEDTPYVVLDWYEAKEVRSLSPKVPDGATPFERATRALEPIRAREPRMHALMLKIAKTFEQDMALMPRLPLGHPNDAGETILQEDCELHPASAMKVDDVTGALPFEPVYIVKEELWSKMSDEQRAVLVLHEIVYRAFRLLAGHETSQFSRYYVGQLLAGTRSIFTSDELHIQALTAGKVPNVWVSGILFNPMKDSFRFDSEGRLLDVSSASAPVELPMGEGEPKLTGQACRLLPQEKELHLQEFKWNGRKFETSWTPIAYASDGEIHYIPGPHDCASEPRLRLRRHGNYVIEIFVGEQVMFEGEPFVDAQGNPVPETVSRLKFDHGKLVEWD